MVLKRKPSVMNSILPRLTYGLSSIGHEKQWLNVLKKIGYNSITMKCQNAQQVCDKNQYKEAGFLDKIKLTIHLIYCRACRKYSSRNNKLSKAIKNSHLKIMDSSDKQKLRETIKKEMIN